MKKIKVVLILLIIWYAPINAQIAISNKVPNIALPNVNDSIVNLSSYQGNIILIDFWASWCGPCRAANPGVVRLYNKYKNKGFIVFGISLDEKKAAWQKAIKQDKIKFIQVNDSEGWNSKVAEKFGVQQIPFNFLLDKSGRLVAIDKEGKELDKLIQHLLQ